MRNKTQEAIEAAERALSRQIDSMTDRLLARIHEVDEGAITAIQKIQPASVDLTQEMADDIVRKIHGPLTIPERVSEWARKEASYHDMQTFSRVGYSPDALESLWWIRANGTLTLELRYPDGSRAWTGTFVPPDFGVSDEPG